MTTDPDAPRPPGGAILWVLLVLPLALRVALAGAALAAVGVGAERFHDGAGYLVVGVLVWLELARFRRRPPADDA